MFDIPQWVMGYFVFPAFFVVGFLAYFILSVKIMAYLCSQHFSVKIIGKKLS